MACLYQNMMMQQGSMAWMQAMCNQQQNGSQYLPNDQVRTAAIPIHPFSRQILEPFDPFDISFPSRLPF